MAGSYMGSSDDDKRAWMVNFVAKLSASMGVYMVSTPDVNAISAAVDDFIAKLTVVQSPDGRNKTTTAQKNDSRAGAVAICGQYVRLIKSNAGIDDSAKISAGINPGNTIPEPRPCPLSAGAVDHGGDQWCADAGVQQPARSDGAAQAAWR